MKVSKRNLKKLIENYLLLEKLSAKDIQKLFYEILPSLQDEIKNDDKFSDTIKNSVIKAVGKTNLFIVPKGAPINDDPSASKYEGFVVHVKFDSKGEAKGETINPDIVTDKSLQSKFINNAVANPILVIFEKNIKSEKELKSLIYHELGHIKNNFLKFYTGTELNAKEVQDVLRKDLIGKSTEDMISVFRSEKRLGVITPPGFSRLIEEYKRYYEGVFSTPPDEVSVDEFAVRIKELQRDVVRQAMIANQVKPMTFLEMKTKYGVDTAGLALFLDKSVTYEKIKKIAKSDINIKQNTRKV